MNKTIYTANIGNLKYAEMTTPITQSYADRCGAELVVIEKTDRSNPQHTFLDAIVAHADRGGDHLALWIDLDIVIRPDALNAFEAFNNRNVWACHTGTRHWRRRFAPFAKKHKLPDLAPYFSTGAVMFNTNHARLLRDAGAALEDWPPVGDQEVFNLLWRKAGVAVRYFPYTFHNGAARQTLKKSDFVHFGAKGKLRRIRQFMKG